MVKTILVPATGTAADSVAFETALAVARLFAAHIDALHVSIDPSELVAATMSSGFSGVIVPQNLIEQWQRESEETDKRTKEWVNQFFGREGVARGAAPAGTQAVTFEWHREIGNELSWIAEYGRSSDLVVAARPAEVATTGRDALQTALLNTGRPLLIPGATSLRAPLGTVAIAWKSTPEAARATSAAAPFFAKADRLVILGIHEGTEAEDASVARLAAALRRRHENVGIETGHALGDGVANALLDAAKSVGADLLVMGGYSHSRLRELIFGGVTEHVLRGAELSVLMSH